MSFVEEILEEGRTRESAEQLARDLVIAAILKADRLRSTSW